MESIFLVLLGWVLGQLPVWHRRKKMANAHWRILGEEILICMERAKQYLNRKVPAPLYRLPTIAFNVSFPVLVSEADIKKNEFKHLIEYYSWAEDINRGLEYAAEAAKTGNSTLLDDEERRIHSKCEKLLSQYLEPVLKTLQDKNVPLN